MLLDPENKDELLKAPVPLLPVLLARPLPYFLVNKPSLLLYSNLPFPSSLRIQVGSRALLIGGYINRVGFLIFSGFESFDSALIFFDLVSIFWKFASNFLDFASKFLDVALNFLDVASNFRDVAVSFPDVCFEIYGFCFKFMGFCSADLY